MPTMWGDVDLENSILGYFYLVATQWRDRSPQAMVDKVNVTTGLPERSSDLLAAHRAVHGDSLALMNTPTPRGLAASMLRYHASSDLACSGMQDCAGCRQLDLKPPAEWSAEESDMVAGLTYRLKLAAHRLGDQGWADVHPPSMDGEPHPLGEDGLTQRFGITRAGLLEARRRAPEQGWESQKRGWQEALTKAEWSKTPEWLQAQQRHQAIQVS